MQINFRIFGFCKIAHGVSFEAIETYLHRNVYPSDTVGDKGKKGLSAFFYASWRINE